jgi:hypothetical protein
MLTAVHVQSAGTFTLSNLGMFGVDRFDAILPPGTVRQFLFLFTFLFSCNAAYLIGISGLLKTGSDHGCWSITTNSSWYKRW